MKVCFGVICIGQSYIDEFNRLFKPSLVAYTTKYGYDLKVFTDYLSTERHHSLISFQKALIPSQECMKEYDLIVVIDGDIFINNGAPPIHTIDLQGKVGIVNELTQLGDEVKIIRSRISVPEEPTEYYKKSGFDVTDQVYLNTGLILCTPQHAEFLKSIYTAYCTSAIDHPRGFHYEQSCIGYELSKNKMYTLIPNEWNHIYLFSIILNRHSPNAWFVHFAGLRGSTRESQLMKYTALTYVRRPIIRGLSLR